MKNLFIISLLLCQFSYGQKLEIEFGKISQQEIELKSYEKDKEAKALILYDKGKSIFLTRMMVMIFDLQGTKESKFSISLNLNTRKFLFLIMLTDMEKRKPYDLLRHLPIIQGMAG